MAIKLRLNSKTTHISARHRNYDDIPTTSYNFKKSNEIINNNNAVPSITNIVVINTKMDTHIVGQEQDVIIEHKFTRGYIHRINNSNDNAYDESNCRYHIELRRRGISDTAIA